MRATHPLLTTAIVFATCAATHAASTPKNLAAASASGALSALKYTDVGGAGMYEQVTDIVPGMFPTCDANPFCITQPKQISGKLAPFNDEMTMVFRGPMGLYNISVYQPDLTNATSAGASWRKVSSWAAGQVPTNLVFMNNNGGDKSGEWSICAGSSQSYANGAWTDATTAPNKEISQGYLDEDHEINIMTAESCTDRPCAGFARGTAHHGWPGSKFFVFTFDMPLPSSPSSNPPAIWVLNAQIVRAAQYGCNCRGVGTGGCGELDVLETLSSSSSSMSADADLEGISEIYSPKGATGSGARFFARPTGDRATYGVIFDEETDSIAIQQYTGWDYAQEAVERNDVEGYLNTPALVVSFGGGAKREVSATRSAGARSRRAEMPESSTLKEADGARHRRRRHGV